MKPSEANANANSVMPSKRKFANAQLQNCMAKLNSYTEIQI